MATSNFIIISKSKKYLVVIAGPTAAGKTALAIQLAKYYDTVVLSADSRQFYQELSIGTAKPSKEELAGVKHYFINTKNIDELYGAGHFERDAIELLEQLFVNRHVVIMAGGSGLYIDAVLNGVDDFQEVPSEIRNELNREFRERGLAWLQDEIQKEDPEYFRSADVQNPQRLIRALEVSRFFKKPYSLFLKRKKRERSFTPVKILVNPERKELYRRIDERVDRMMKEGLLEEARKVAGKKNHNALKTVGYKELYDFMDGKTDLETAVAKIKQHTRNYAKRQITWFRNKDKFTEFMPGEFEKITAYINDIIGHD